MNPIYRIVDFDQKLYLLRVLYSKIINILDAFCGGDVVFRDAKLNFYYTIFCEEINGILGLDGFEELKQKAPILVESLVGDVEGVRDEWEIYGSKLAYNFFGSIENTYIKSDAKTFQLPKDIENNLIAADKAIEEHKQKSKLAFKGIIKIAEDKKSQSIIKPKTLELIAQEIGNLETGNNLINFLTDCGVENKFIEYPQTKWRMVYAVLITLATSPNLKDQEVLFKIIEGASHPLMHNGDEELAKEYEDKFNKLLKYDGFILRNYKLKEINEVPWEDEDLDLYIKKKILLEKWRDDLPHPICQLSFNNNTIEQICSSLWSLFVSKIISFGSNTSPENILIEYDPRFNQGIAFNWNLIKDLDNNPHKVEYDYGFEIEILDEKRLIKDINKEIDELELFFQDLPHNCYAYKKQKEILLNFIANLYNQFENEFLVLKFNEIEDENVNVLRTVIALEAEGFFNIEMLSNYKQEWTDKDNVFIKIQLVKSKIPTIKKFISINDKQKQEIKDEVDSEFLSNKREIEPIPIKIVDEVRIRGFEEKVILQKPKNKRIQLRKFPSGLKWEEITIRFLNEHEAIIKARNDTFQTDYDVLGFQDEKKKLPNKQWTFLRLLAMKNGEISWENNRNLSPQQINSIKKQKQLLSETLKACFQIENEPFYDYKKEKAYKIKINLIPEVNSAAD